MGKQADALTKKAKKPELDEEENAEPVKKQKVANGDGNKVAKAQTKLAPKAEAKAIKKAAKAESEEEESDEAPAPVKKGKAPVKQDSDSEEEAPKAKAKPAAGKKPVAKPADDDEEEEEKAPAKKGGFVEGDHEIFVKGLSYDADEEALRELFAECGDIKSINLLKNEQGRSKGIAFIKFESADALDGAVAYNGTEHMGRSLQVEKSRPKGERPPRPEFNRGGADGDSSTIFVGNLSYSTTEDGLYEFFGAHGEVKAVRLAKQPDGKLKGFAHVEFAEASSASDAVSKNGTELDGRQIKVDLAGKRPPSNGFGGGFGGGRGGGRGGFGGGRGGGRGGGFRGGRGRY